MNPTLPDIQRTLDKREVAISRVGVTGIKLPIRVRRSASAHGGDERLYHLETVGEFEVAALVPDTVKGTHMSRFTEVLNEHVGNGGVFSISDLQEVAAHLLKRLETDQVFVQLKVDYFMPQEAPVSHRPGVAPLTGILQLEARYVRAQGKPDPELVMRTWTGIEILGKTCCPCSREISKYDHATGMGKGAHAQRGKISVLVAHSPGVIVWFEELARAAWRAFSQPVYPVLKRPDEAHVTMGAYDNPKFVEDVIRDMTCQLREMPKVRGFRLRVQNAESIHYHDAYAELEENFQ